MSRLAPRGIRRAVAVLGVAAALLAAPLSTAEPYETNPNLAVSDADYAAGKQAMERKLWSEAAQRFQAALRRNPDSADLQNYLGYTHRNLKQFDLAFKYYKRAIELDPRHRGAHEYIGEAYLMVGDLPNAERHLAKLRDICLLPCEELGDLEKSVAAYRAKFGRQN